MSARRLVCHGLVLGPVVLLGYLGLGARLYEETFEFQHCGPRDQAIINAYVQPVGLSERLHASLGSPASRTEARKIARFWVSSAQTGRLRPIPAHGVLTGSRYPVLDQIVAARFRVCQSMAHCAEIEKGLGNYGLAAQDSVLALLVAQIGSEADPLTVTYTARRQRHILAQMQSLVKQLDTTDRAKIAKGLDELSEMRRQTDRYLATLTKVYGPPRPELVAAVARRPETSHPAQAFGSRIDDGEASFSAAYVSDLQVRAGILGIQGQIHRMSWHPRIPPSVHMARLSQLALSEP